jgi:hypothetical protein
MNTNSNDFTEKQLQFINNITHEQERKQKHMFRGMTNTILYVSENTHIHQLQNSIFNKKTDFM